MNIVKWFNSLRLFSKTILVYMVFAVVPMLAVTGYNYTKTRQLLEKQSYQEMQQTMETTEKSLNVIFQSCETIMDMLYSNQMLNSYLNMDYTKLSYWEMFSYIDKLLHNISVFNPNISRISFYSDNMTLPQDNYYFYRKSELPAGFEQKAFRESGRTSACGVVQNQDEAWVGLVRRMNYFYNGDMETYLLIGIDLSWLNRQLATKDESRRLFLTDSEGQILACGQTELVGKSIGSLFDGWDGIAAGGSPATIHIDEKSFVCIRQNGAMGTGLFLLRDQESILREAGRVSGRLLFIFAVSSSLVFFAVFAYGRLMQRRVDQVVYAAKKLGDGQFDYRLKDMGKDEIGQIGNAFNLLNERIQVLIRDNYEKKLLVKSSEMNLLQEQINPHFLYNALSVISSVAMREGGRKTVESVRYLADFYRISLNKGRQVIPVMEELELVKNYMKIQTLRFGDSVEVSYDADRNALSCRTLKLLVQPLVENAIHHGRRDEETLHIRVTVGLDRGRVFYEVEDDGLGIEPEKLVALRRQLRQSQEGFGLKNVDIRAKLHYGEEYGVTAVNSSLEKGTRVRVEIPAVNG